MAKKKLSRIERETPTYAGPRSLRDARSGKFVPQPKTKRKGKTS